MGCIERHEPVRTERGMRGHQKIYQQPFGRSPPDRRRAGRRLQRRWQPPARALVGLRSRQTPLGRLGLASAATRPRFSRLVISPDHRARSRWCLLPFSLGAPPGFILRLAQVANPGADLFRPPGNVLRATRYRPKALEVDRVGRITVLSPSTTNSTRSPVARPRRVRISCGTVTCPLRLMLCTSS